MAKLSYFTTIAIDTRRYTIHYFSMLGNDVSSIDHRIKHYSGAHFDDAFFARFKEVITEFAKETPSQTVQKISLVVPDNCVALDTINVPTMRNRLLTKNALNLALGKNYRNMTDLKVQFHACAQNRQYTTFSTAAIQKRILTGLYSACSENKLLVDTTTYASSAAIGAVAILNPKLKNATYLFLDLKDTYSRFVFVENGRPAGFYPLPFGLEFLSRPKYVQEDMLFDHTMAELTVLNAREKAKAKKLSMLAGETSDEEESEVQEISQPVQSVQETKEAEEITGDLEAVESEDVLEQPFTMTPGQRIVTPKYMARKTPRKLPKFMQRPNPETEEAIACENFRVFVKWALSLLSGNEKITQFGMPEAVFVNIPESLAYVLDAANEEAEESGVEFGLIGYDYDPTVLANLELYGGLFPKAIHAANKF
ncbi:MAG: hypothetical protein E7293_10100 [Lachnospiraceae bacterium]|nr:hypothetical protein [Lachnospiraceae bacterium]